MRRAVVLIVATTLLAGCGGGGAAAPGAGAGSDATYVRAVNAAQTQFAQTFTRLSKRIGATSTPAQGRRTLTAFEDAVHGTVARLRAVRPPERVRPLHGRLVSEIAAYGDHLAAARRAYGSHDARRVLAAQGRLVDEVRATSAQINRTIDAINQRLKS